MESWGMCRNYVNEDKRHRRVFRSQRIAYGEGLRYRLSMAGDRLQMQESTEMSPINLLRGLDSPDKMSFFFLQTSKKSLYLNLIFTNLCCSTTEDNWIKHLDALLVWQLLDSAPSLAPCYPFSILSSHLNISGLSLFSYRSSGHFFHVLLGFWSFDTLPYFQHFVARPKLCAFALGDLIYQLCCVISLLSNG